MTYLRKLCFEPLEDRRLLSITVNTLVDENDGIGVGGISLRDAIAGATAGETIDFAPSLTASGPVTMLLTHGELLVNKNVLIQGPGADLLTIDASGSDPTPDEKNGDGSRVLNIDNGIEGDMLSLTIISGVTLTGADISASGGGIRTSEPLRLASSVVTGNHSQHAAGIYALETALTIDKSSIGNNVAEGAYGGVLGWLSNITVTSSEIRDNIALSNAGGGIGGYGGNLTISASLVSGNKARGAGGGIYFSGDVYTLEIRDSTISQNVVLPLESTSPFLDGLALGGGVAARGQTTVVRSTISENSASMGGGIFGSAAFTISESAITGNVASGNGGGLLISYGAIELNNSTVSSNTARGNGGGMSLYTNYNPATIRNSTIASNTASFGLGIAAYDTHVIVDHSIVAAEWQTVGSPVPTGIKSDVAAVFGSVVDARYSLIAYNTFSTLSEAPVGSPDANGNLIGGPVSGLINPQLAPLADNGGPTMTHALLGESPAIDAGDTSFDPDAFTPPMIHDQRGAPFARVIDGDAISGARIDIGAVERQPIPPAVFGDYNGDDTVNAADYTVWRNTLGQTDLDPYSGADGNGDGKIDRDDFLVWKDHYGETVPNPAGGAAHGAGVADVRANGATPPPAASLLGDPHVQVAAPSISGTEPAVSFRSGAQLDSPIVNDAHAGQTVYLRVDDPALESGVVQVTVWEDDGGADDETATLSVSVQDGVGFLPWTAAWQANDDSDPFNRYYLQAASLGVYSGSPGVGHFAVRPAVQNSITGEAPDGGGDSSTVTIRRVDTTEPIETSVITWIVTHGFNSSAAEPWVDLLTDTIEAAGDLAWQVLTIDWAEGAGSFSPYWVKPVGSWVADVLADYGLNGLDVNLIGHSWGSYVMDELAEAMPGGVGVIVGLDPGAIPGSYSAAEVNFAQHSQWSVGFHSSDWWGNAVTTVTADAAIVVQVDGDGLFNFHAHQSIHDLFTYMIATPAGGVSRMFDLDRLLLGQGGAWIHNRYNDDGGPTGNYEAVIATVGNDGLVPQSITYFASGSGSPRTVLETDFLGDYNFDDAVNAADYTVWRNMRGSTTDMGADGDGDGIVTQLDYQVWKQHFGETVPAAVAAGQVATDDSLRRAVPDCQYQVRQSEPDLSADALKASVVNDGAGVTSDDVVGTNVALLRHSESAYYGSATHIPLAGPRALIPVLSQREREWIERDAALLGWLDARRIPARASANGDSEFTPDDVSADMRQASETAAVDDVFDLLAVAI